jgi:ribosomal protein L11 methyltransferase
VAAPEAPPQAWLQLEFPLGELDAERVQDALEALGALAVTLADAADDPIYEPPPGATPLWQRSRVTALFDAATDRAALREALSATLEVPLPAHRFTVLADRDWEREWLKDFKPMRFGARLWVVPTAFQAPEPGAVNLILDPGLAFGTGTHPTTALCLEWLDDHAQTLAGKRVLDFGCGSGILAIAAALLGAREVEALDLDPQALLATEENAARNGVAARIQVALPEAGSVGPFDLLVANILSGPLIDLAPVLMARLGPGAPFALSGILAAQAAEVAAAYAPFAAMSPPVARGDWVRLDGLRR